MLAFRVLSVYFPGAPRLRRRGGVGGIKGARRGTCDLMGVGGRFLDRRKWAFLPSGPHAVWGLLPRRPAGREVSKVPSKCSDQGVTQETGKEEVGVMSGGLPGGGDF